MVEVYGIRHHGPGSARALQAALEATRPACVLVEGPPEGDAVLALAADMEPPVALLVYAADDPAHAAFYPFARFSPEWVAIRWALAHDVPVSFCDLPQSAQLGARAPDAEGAEGAEGAESARPAPPDPLGLLAQAEGYEDRDGWWDAQIESRTAVDTFAAVRELMVALRLDAPAPVGREARREAWMRRTLRAAEKQHGHVAAVVGAWHVPALLGGPPKKVDDETLRDLPRRKVVATWIPWTYGRLAAESGYGAGVSSPAWYDLLWTEGSAAPTTWLASAARLLRSEDLDASSASVVEAVRLAQALRALRGRPAVALPELREAARTVLCRGEDAPLDLVHRRLVVGEQMGRVPEGAPTVPLQRDLDQRARSLRLKQSPVATPLDLDLREEGGRARSAFLHQLQLLGVPWGEPQADTNRTGTFRESWTLTWAPELALRVVEASAWGATVPSGATARAVAGLGERPLAELATRFVAVLRADLAEAVGPLLRQIQVVAAGTMDVAGLTASLPPLAQVVRYGDVRGTPVDHLRPLYDELVERAIVDFAPASAALSEDAARGRVASLHQLGEALSTAGEEGQRAAWIGLLHHLAGSAGDDPGVGHPLLRGVATRKLLDARALPDGALVRLARRHLGAHLDPADAAAWLEGLLEGGATLLLHQEELWRTLDAWLAGLAEDAFVALLPALRRAFASFSGPERARLGQRVRRPTGPAPTTRTVDEARAARVLPVLRLVLGGEGAGTAPLEGGEPPSSREKAGAGTAPLEGGEPPSSREKAGAGTAPLEGGEPPARRAQDP